MDLNDKKERLDHETKNTPKSFHSNLAESFNDDDDLYIIKFTSVKETEEAKEGYASYDGVKTATSELNMKIYHMIHIKQSQLIHTERDKAYKLFRSCICRSGHHFENCLCYRWLHPRDSSATQETSG
mmetsp:Transcript_21877/g.60824  ORF Transcript_21877/g.60824 Transcript_21877/m.60824 type:complete len:127 (-) Transcript_21877:746-1126(-)